MKTIIVGNGAPGEIRTPDPQIRSLGSTIEIIEVRSHKDAAEVKFVVGS